MTKRQRVFRCLSCTTLVSILGLLWYLDTISDSDLLPPAKLKLNTIRLRNNVFNVNVTLPCDHSIPLIEIFKDAVTSSVNTYQAIWVNKQGHLAQRLDAYVQALKSARSSLVKLALRCPWVSPEAVTDVINGNSRLNYLSDVSASGHVLPIVLPWLHIKSEQNNMTSQYDESNLLIKKYYQWTASPNSCTFIKSASNRFRWDIVFNHYCSSDTNLLRVPKSMEYEILNVRPINEKYIPFYPSHFYTDPPQHLSYILMATGVFITSTGEIYTKNTTLFPATCLGYNRLEQPDRIKKYNLYDEVFTISQFWGAKFFHMHVENFPRLAPFVQFLRDHPEIKLHLADNKVFTRSLVQVLGIAPNRIVLGNVRAKIGYMPETTYCGIAHPLNVQLLSQYYREKIREMHPGINRDTILLIRRSRLRQFAKQNQIAEIIQNIAQEHHVRYELFRDDPPSGLNATMQSFNRAIMVIGPHGGGLSNLLFSEPGTYVIEGMCNKHHIHMCYTRLAYLLGLRWHGVAEVSNGCHKVVDINVRTLEDTVRTLLKQAISETKIPPAV